MTTLRIREFDPDTASSKELSEFHELMVADSKADRPGERLPTFEGAMSWLRMNFSGHGSQRYWGAWLDGSLRGWVKVELPTVEQQHAALLNLRVHPYSRRQGIGKALLKTAVATIERPVVRDSGVVLNSPGHNWEKSMGFTEVETMVLQHLFLDDADEEPRSGSLADRYQLASWTKQAPAFLLDSYAQARNAIQDSPNSSEHNPTLWTAALVRENEDRLRGEGVEQLVSVASEVTSGKVVAVTIVELHPGRKIGYLTDTCVVREHRGEGLGLAVKDAIQRKLRQEHPDIEKIQTSVHRVNSHMLRINEHLGYRTFRTIAVMQHDTTELSQHLGIT